MMMNEKMIHLAALIMIVFAAINIGLQEYNGTDLLKHAGDFQKYAHYAIALAGIFVAYKIYQEHM